MRGLILTVLVLLSGWASAGDSYLCVADKVTGFEFDERARAWEVATFSGGDYKFIVRPLQAGSERHKIGYRNVVLELGGDNTEIALCREGSDVYGWLNCGELRDPYKFNIRKETLRFIMTFNGSYMTSTREVHVEGRDVIVKEVPDKGGNAPLIAIGQCSPI